MSPETKTPEASNEQAKDKGNPKGPESRKRNSPETSDKSNPMKDASEGIRRDVDSTMRNTKPERKRKTTTPFQEAQRYTKDPLRKTLKTAAFIANPVVYGTVAGADWLAQRTPGVKTLYTGPREIIRGTADKALNVVNASATFIPALPSTILYEIEDKVSGLDVSKPTSLAGKILDKIGDGIGFAFNLGKTGMEKLYELGKKVVPPIGDLIGKAVTLPFSATFGTIGKMYKAIGSVGGLTGLLGSIALTGALSMAGHAAITATLPSISLPAYDAYVSAVTFIRSLLGI